MPGYSKNNLGILGGESLSSSRSSSVSKSASRSSASRSSRSSASRSSADTSRSSVDAEGVMEEKSGLDMNELLNQQRARSDMSPSSIALYDALAETTGYQDETFDDLVETLHENLGELAALAQLPIIKSYNSTCIRNMANWSKIDKEHQLDKPEFDPKQVADDIQTNAPKMAALLKNIRELDAADMKKYGRKFKHFIFSDIKSKYGAKIIASALLSQDYVLGTKTVAAATTQKKNSKNGSRGQKGGVEKKVKLALKTDAELLESKFDNFFLLTSTTLFDNPMRVELKKNILKKFNQRPDNVYGQYARIIIMDSGFKEGIDLFDIKYVHIYEPQTTMADQKQVIGRGTRTCGQKGLKFSPTQGWPLHIYKYDVEIPEPYRGDFNMATSAFDMYLKSKHIDIRVFNLTSDMEQIAIFGSVDYELNRNVHLFSVEEEREIESVKSIRGGALVRRHDAVRKYVKDNYRQFAWDKVKMENLCGYEGPASMAGGAETSDFGIVGGAGQLITYSPTQRFVSHYFGPHIPLKGMLLYQSVGTGKTCTAIATATKQFEPAGYTILWVTRTTLRNDIWKNMFEQICNEQIREKVEAGMSIPDAQQQRMRMLSKAWSIRPMSYKQFSNLVSKKNVFYKALVKKNGEADPLHKTLLIIDEAHKLFGGNDLSSIERPDTDALHAALMNSYLVSGENSVKLMLMTATPITQDPLELVKLLNLCKLPDKQIADNMDVFSATYLDERGFFTETGKAMFLDQIAGHISYLNREGDARQFARPILHEVQVPMLNAESKSLLEKYDKINIRNYFGKLISDYKKVVENSRKTKKIGVKDLTFLKNKCAPYLSKKTKTRCKKIVNGHIKEIMADQKSMLSEMNKAIHAAKKEIAALTGVQKEKLASVAANIEKNKEGVRQFRDSFYNRLRSNCIDKFTDVSLQKKVLESHPAMVVVKRTKEIAQSKLNSLDEIMKNTELGHKRRILALRGVLKEDLSELERQVVLATIKAVTKQLAEEKVELRQQLASKNKTLKSVLSYADKQEKMLVKNIRKTAKNQLNEATNAEKERKKAEKEVKELVQSSDELEEHIREKVKDHEAVLEIDLEVMRLEDDALYAEELAKEAEKEARAAERKAAAAEKGVKAASEKEAAKLAKAAEKAAKAAERAAKAAEKK